MKHVLWMVLFFVSSISAESVELTASQFNATYSAKNPLILSELVSIFLDENIIIDVDQPLFVLPVELPLATLRFFSESAVPASVQIAPQALFTIENRSGGRCNVEFQGNAQFLLFPGSNVWFTNTIFKFLETSRIVPMPEVMPV
jgi:hypothetical protein